MAVTGDKVAFGELWCASDTVTADIAEWDVEASGTIVEVVSIVATSGAAAGATEPRFSVQDAGNNHLIQSFRLHTNKSLFVEYPVGNFPRLNGLTVDTPSGTVNTTNTVAYSIVYRKA